MKTRLDPCRRTPNCVSSRDERRSCRVAPLAFAAPPAAAFRRAVEAVRSLPRVRIVALEEGYLRAELRSPLVGFVDDLELLLDGEAGVIHVRSASRVGYSDFGVNRRRVERLRRRLERTS